MFCQHCGAKIPDNALFCTECGQSVNDAEPSSVDVIEQVQEEQNKPKKKTGLIIAVIIVAIIAVAGFFIYQMIRTENYKRDLYNTFANMSDGLAKAEDICVLEANVWSNCIFQKQDLNTNKYTMLRDGVFHEDFNDALAELFADDEIIKKQAEVYDNQIQTTRDMKKLKNPPSECGEEYELIKEYYDVYMDFTNLALNASGYTLQDFNDTLNDYQKDSISYIKKISVLFQ